MISSQRRDGVFTFNMQYLLVNLALIPYFLSLQIVLGKKIASKVNTI